MFKSMKLRLAAWIVELPVVKWAHRVEGERFRRDLYQVFGALDEYEAICSEERNGISAKK